MFDTDDELTLQEIASDDYGYGDDRLVEGAVEVSTVAGAAFSGGSFVLGLLSAHRQCGRAAYEEATSEEIAELRRQLHEVRRQQAYEFGGLTGLDEFDERHYDDPYTDFEAY